MSKKLAVVGVAGVSAFILSFIAMATTFLGLVNKWFSMPSKLGFWVIGAEFGTGVIGVFVAAPCIYLWGRRDEEEARLEREKALLS